MAQAYVRTLDQRVRRVTARGRTVTEALDKLRAREREVAGVSAAASSLTVEAFVIAWLEHKRASVKPRTHRDYVSVFEHHVLPEIGSVALTKLRPVHVQRVLDKLASRGRRAQAYNLRRYLKQAFEQAVAWEYLARNPVAGTSRVEVPAPKRGLWTIEQVTRFLTVTRDRSWYHPLFLTAVVTGLRQGELVALPWENVTSERVRVDRTWSRDEIVGYDTPKTRHAYRDVPISRDVHEVLLARRARTGSSLVFPTEVGTMALPWNVHRSFVRFTLAAGLERIRFHDLRRVAATLWARQGVEPKVIQQLLGHSTPHLALSVYQGVLDERVDSARLDARMLFGGYATSHGLTLAGDGDADSVVLERVVN